MADSSTGGLINDLLMPTYYSGVLQRSSPKNYVMHPARVGLRGVFSQTADIQSRLLKAEFLEPCQ
jgi:hypothetical protein